MSLIEAVLLSVDSHALWRCGTSKSISQLQTFDFGLQRTWLKRAQRLDVIDEVYCACNTAGEHHDSD